MTERDAIFARIREALRRPAPVPGQPHPHHSPEAAPHADPRVAVQARQWLPAVGPTFEEWATLFRTNALELKAEFELLDNPGAMIEAVRKIARNDGWKRVASHGGSLTHSLCAELDLPVLSTDQPYDVNELETCDASITECDALIAQTGSVLVTSRSAGGRALSVLPPHHVVLARNEQLLPDLPAAFELLQRKYGPNYPSFISFITGPSRTGDIERILVLGAHGPKRLTVLCA